MAPPTGPRPVHTLEVPPPAKAPSKSGIERAREFLNAESTLTPGVCAFVPEGKVAVAVDILGMHVDRVLALRARLTAQGYDPAPEGHGIVCPGIDGAEIWWADDAVSALLFQRRLRKKADGDARRAPGESAHKKLVQEVAQAVRSSLP
jgi:hypothetical protein